MKQNRRNSIKQTGEGKSAVATFSSCVTLLCVSACVFLTSLPWVDVFLCLGVGVGGSEGEIQAASLSCVQQKRATGGQLCFGAEPRTTAPSTSALIPASTRRNKKISHWHLLTSAEENAAFWSEMLQKYIICVLFVTRSNFFFFLGN